MNPANILLTGGTGFFGRALLRTWLAESVRCGPVAYVTVLSRNPSSFLLRFPEFQHVPWLSFHTGDICDPSSLPWGTHFPQVLHAAADSFPGIRLTPLARYQQVVEGTRNILELAIAVGARRFLLTSSGGVYGPQPPDLAALAEDWPGSPDLRNPANAYSLGKRAAEHLCALYQEANGIEMVIARCFAFVGRDLPLDAHFAIGNFIRDALSREAIEVVGDGSPLRTYLDQDDMAHWLLTLLASGRPGEVYNVGSDEVVTIAELAHRVRDLLAPNKPVRVQGQRQDTSGRNRYVPDIRKAHAELGLGVTIPLAESIRRTGAAHRERVMR
jgi:UDP-glucuronate decarboxylase